MDKIKTMRDDSMILVTSISQDVKFFLSLCLYDFKLAQYNGMQFLPSYLLKPAVWAEFKSAKWPKLYSKCEWN